MRRPAQQSAPNAEKYGSGRVGEEELRAGPVLAGAALNRRSPAVSGFHSEEANRREPG